MNDATIQPICRNVKLDVLLFGDEHSVEYRDFARHVESCRHCQDRLAELAADEGDWTRVRTMLCSEQIVASPDISSASNSSRGNPNTSIRRIKLDFLSPPSHPEMLGRLDRYEIELVIGKGGMGIVLKGFDTELHRPVAIKVLAPHVAHSSAAKQRFAREARAAASIVHEHVVAIHDVKSDQEMPYLVMQYVPGRSLQERVEQEGPLSPPEILRIGMQAAAGLAAAHEQGVVHRDVKPANILLENGVERAMLTDFGLARATDDATLTRSGIIAGTPHYMSPEQAQGAHSDARSDLFSLGAVLYFMATGHPPFRAEQAMAILHRICHDRHRPVQEINPSIPNELADLIDCLLEKKASRRFATASEVQHSLARALARIQQPQRWNYHGWLRVLSRYRWSLPTVACVLLSIVGIAWLASWRSNNADADRAVTSISTPESTPTSKVLADQLIAKQHDWASVANDLAVIGQSQSQIENSQRQESLSNFSANDSWLLELQAATGEAQRLEKVWSPESNSVPSVNFKKGKKHE